MSPLHCGQVAGLGNRSSPAYTNFGAKELVNFDNDVLVIAQGMAGGQDPSRGHNGASVQTARRLGRWPRRRPARRPCDARIRFENPRRSRPRWAHGGARRTRTGAEWFPDLAEVLASAGIGWTLEHATPPDRWTEKVAQFEAAKRWFEDD